MTLTTLNNPRRAPPSVGLNGAAKFKIATPRGKRCKNTHTMQDNIGLFLTKRAHLSPDLDGFIDVDTGRRFTYREWNERCNQTVSVLAGLGVKKGNRVALLLMNSIEFAESFFAIAKLGAVCVPLNWRLTPEELSFIVRDAEVQTMIYGSEFRSSAVDLQERGPTNTAAINTAEPNNPADGTAITNWLEVTSSGERPPFALDYTANLAAADSREPDICASDDDMLYIMYTSGTTGLPKGAVHTHSTAMWGVLTINATADQHYADRYLLSLPLFHVGALTPCTGAVHRGATLIVMRQFDPKKAWELIGTEQINNALKVPAMLNLMLDAYDPTIHNTSTLRWIMSGAAPVPVSLIQAYAELDIEIQQVYGLTETCAPACLISSEDALRRAGSTGKAFFHTDVRVVDGDDQDVAPGAFGEVIIRGRHIMREYWKQPEATARSIRNGWFFSGDGATVDEDGFVYIQDRIKDMYIAGGENVYPAEIENVLAGHNDIVEAAVIGIASKKWGELGAAIIVRKNLSLTEQQVRDYCVGQLASFKQPAKVYFVDSIPRNPSGKILKRVLRKDFAAPADE